MKNHVIDNSLKNLGKTVLWQYDRAYRLLSILKHMQVVYHCAVEQFWNYWTTRILSIDTCGAFGCSLWGMFLGVPRPTIKDSETGEERLIATSVYRRILKGAFYLMKASSSYEDILGYMEIVFGVGGSDNLSPWQEYVSEYGWSTNVKELNEDQAIVAEYFPRLAYSKGTVFQNKSGELVTRWRCLEDITAAENTTLEGLESAGKVALTMEPATVISSNDTLLLELYDPEGKRRKIGGAPNNALSIRVDYDFGETHIVAEVTRRRKCGLTLTDNGDMSMTYGKSEYYDEMHRDQKALFEQRFDEFCPFPLGVKTNEPVGNWVFGLPVGDKPPIGVQQYQPRQTYYKKEDGYPYSVQNSFLIQDMYDQYQLLLVQGPYVKVRFPIDVPPAAGISPEWTRERDPIYNAIELERYKTKADIPLGLEEYDWHKSYNANDVVVMDFIAILGPKGHTKNPILFWSPYLTITQDKNTFFWKLYFVTESKTLLPGQSNILYEVGKAYGTGDIFGYIESDGDGYNWKTTSDVTAEENTSFEAIKAKLQKTSEGGPFVEGMGEMKRPYIDFRNKIPSIEIMTKDPTEVVSIIAADRLVVGRENGVDKIFRNTTGGSLIICHSTIETTKAFNPAGVGNWTDWIGVDEPTNDNILAAIAVICRKWNCLVLDFEQAVRFNVGVQYYIGDVVVVDDTERIVNANGRWNTKEELLANSVPQSRACLHEFYPYVK